MASCAVQNVSKASSDELLRKFADLDSEADRKSSRKAESISRRRCKRSRTAPDSGDGSDSPNRNGKLVERKSLLSPANRKSLLLPQLGTGQPTLRSKEIIVSRYLINKLEKAWHKTVEGASKIFMKKHCNQHIRLRNEFV